MMSLRIALLLLCLAGAVAPIRGQDFDLNDAFDEPPPTKTPTKKPAIPDKPPAAPTKTPVIPNKPPAGGDGFDLEDALGGGGADHVTKKPVPRPNPGGGGGGEFGDADLFDAAGVDPNKPHKPSDPLPPRDMGYTISKMETIQQLLQLLKTPLSILLEIMETTEQSIRDFLNSFKE